MESTESQWQGAAHLIKADKSWAQSPTSVKK